jgi:hypothetical protein
MAKTQRLAQKNNPRMTEKETGFIVTSLRLPAEANKTLRKASAEVGMSFNWWAVQTLTAAAKKILKKDK